MGSFVSDVQAGIMLLLGLLALGMEIFALVHALRARPDAFVAASKQSKPIWVGLLAVAVLLGIAAVGGVGLLTIIGVVIAGIYLADVRPALEQVMGRSSGSGWR